MPHDPKVVELLCRRMVINDPDDYDWTHYRDDVVSVLDAIMSAGFAVVPVEATEAMIEMGSVSIADDLPTEAVWGNMIAASTTGEKS